jgi:cytosine permease
VDDFAALTGDHAHQPVPVEDRIGGARLALILANTVVCVPNLLLAAQVAGRARLGHALPSLWIGGAALGLMGAATAVVGARANLSTSMILQFPFGRSGGRLVNIVLLLSILGLYSVTAAVFGGALAGAVDRTLGLSLPAFPFTVLGSALMVLATIYGFRTIRWLAAGAVPVLLLLLGAMLLAVHAGVRAPAGGLSGGGLAGGPMSGRDIVSAVIGSYILGVIVMPDMIRFTRTAAGGVLAAVFALAVALPLFLWAAMFIAAAAGTADLSSLVLVLGLGAPALLALTLVSWTNNANNLYSASLVFAAIVPRIAKWKLGVAAGTVGTLLALLPVVAHYLPFLAAISVLLPPLAGIYVSDFVFIRGGRYDLADIGASGRIDYGNLLIWMLAAGVGALTATGVARLTGLPGLDALLAGFLIHALVHWRTRAHRLSDARSKLRP